MCIGPHQRDLSISKCWLGAEGGGERRAQRWRNGESRKGGAEQRWRKHRNTRQRGERQARLVRTSGGRGGTTREATSLAVAERGELEGQHGATAGQGSEDTMKHQESLNYVCGAKHHDKG
jgi:hypothetical protein